MIVCDHSPNGVAAGWLVHSEQDTQSSLRRTAALDQLDGSVEVDVHAGREIDRRLRVEARAHQRLGPPAYDQDLDGILNRDYDFFEQRLHTSE